jgi:hypothetical protein
VRGRSMRVPALPDVSGGQDRGTRSASFQIGVPNRSETEEPAPIRAILKNLACYTEEHG